MHCSKALPGLPHATQEGLDRARDGSFTEPPFERFPSGALESGLTFKGWPGRLPAAGVQEQMSQYHDLLLADWIGVMAASLTTASLIPAVLRAARIFSSGVTSRSSSRDSTLSSACFRPIWKWSSLCQQKVLNNMPKYNQG
ncbi:MAG: hypothetical protein FRX49_05594 [Trebouxia sp. A1-2]|nr:MAG: hypothetical protein FRX49_05594 [Trebouxia sp. A1-2]